MSDDRPLVDSTYAKTGKYGETIREIEEAKVCPFCPDHFNWHPNPILHRSGGWFLTESSQPYEGTQLHLMLIREEHAQTLLELSAQDFVSIGSLAQWAVREYEIPGGALCMRFGETRFTGATVAHIHAHLLVPQLDPSTDRAKVVNWPVG